MKFSTFAVKVAEAAYLLREMRPEGNPNDKQLHSVMLRVSLETRLHSSESFAYNPVAIAILTSAYNNDSYAVRKAVDIAWQWSNT